jgi:hypothetical protein
VRRSPGTKGPGPTLVRFLGEVAAICGRPAHTVEPGCRLIADLGFDALAFARLDLLLFEVYEVRDTFRALDAGGRELTVEMVFERYAMVPWELRG